MATTKTCQHDYYFYPNTNEEGWKCCMCEHRPGEPPGFSPELDRSDIFRKVSGLCHDLHEHHFVYFSNRSHGDGVAAAVADRCETEGVFDQYTIVQWVLETESKSHGKYWAEISESILSGKDKRDRCPCGALSSVSSSKEGGGWDYRCSKHWMDDGDIVDMTQEATQ